ncbi:MAG TPA: 2-isopropylmalate synthase [Bacteroidota bacterium]|nr:2-isopropylmalate synthase [Bacteroidota bacterium]
MHDRIFIFDTTLRDGEQSPGCSMNVEEKLRMARQLERLNVDIVEAGFPASSAGDFEAVRAIAGELTRCAVAGLSRALLADIDRTWEAIRGARRPRIHTFIATSDIHLAHKLKKTREQVLADAVRAVEYARTLTQDVEFSCEDASRTDPGYLAEIAQAVVAAGAAVLNLPDTVGYAVPEEYGAMFRRVRERLGGAPVILSAHCHNDLGLAVANSLAAIENGARQIECTVNGIGERAGNAALEEIVIALNVRSEKLGAATTVEATEIYRSSRLLSSLTGMMVQRNKAIVGANAFAHEAGIHQDGMLKSAITYEIVTPQTVGIRHSTLVLGKHSGRHALRKRYAELGYDLTAEELERAYTAFCALADTKKEVYDEELIAVLDAETRDAASDIRLVGLHVSTGTSTRPTATVELRRGEETMVDSATGDGPVDAMYRAIERLTGVVGRLTEYSLKSVSTGHDTVGEVFVRVEFDGVSYNGRAVSTDVITGSARAYLEAMNRALTVRSRREGRTKQSIAFAAGVV